MIDDFTEEWAVLYIYSSDFHFGRIWVRYQNKCDRSHCWTVDENDTFEDDTQYNDDNDGDDDNDDNRLVAFATLLKSGEVFETL